MAQQSSSRMFCHYMKILVSSLGDISNHQDVHFQMGGSACHLPRAPGRETEKAWFERKPPHLHVAEAVLWWKQCVVLLSTNCQLRPQCEVR